MQFEGTDNEAGIILIRLSENVSKFLLVKKNTILYNTIEARIASVAYRRNVHHDGDQAEESG